MAEQGDYTNHLKGETSPYLLQHLNNPVDWYPWGDQALQRARSEDKPILLSIGYSACHWCHVMAHESFEDPVIGALMNEHFINVKVDREERPDLDKIYQSAHSLLAQRPGGWPLTLFLTPHDQMPFFAGTYFPKQPRHGLPGFADLLRHIDEVYRTRRSDIESQNDSLRAALHSLSAPPPGNADLSAIPLETARRSLEQQFDPAHGGFGKAPKFPHPTSIERLMRHYAATRAAGGDDPRALHMAIFTLEKMALGGMNDQLGGGFCRYSVDDYWMIPHFEKMLYDNGPLLALYAQAHAINGDALFERVCRETATWVMREMQAPEGGYYSSLDADSEGEEGKFYVWERDEVAQRLGADYALFAARYGLDRDANFEGRWNLHVFSTIAELAERFELPVDEVEERLQRARIRLLAVRNERVWPGRDDKILTSWNALMIRGMAMAGRRFDEASWWRSAERALDFIRAELWRDGRLLATAKDGRAHLNAYLDDYVFLIDAILELVQTRWRDGDLDFAIELADAVLTHFQDPAGGFFFTSDDHEELIQRTKPLGDEAIPSGNGIAAGVLGRLGHLLGEARYLDAAERTLHALWSPMEQNAYACSSLLNALEEQLQPGEFLILRGKEEALGAWRSEAFSHYAPKRITLAIPDTATMLPGLLAQRTMGAESRAYLCQGTHCLPVIDSVESLHAALMR